MFGLNILEELAITVMLVLIAFGTGAGWGAHKENVKWKTAMQVQQVQFEKTLLTAKEHSVIFVDHYVQGDTQIQTVFKDRIIYRTKEVNHEVVVRSDAACGAIPAWFVGMWNSANQTGLPDAAATFDARPTAVKLSDVSAQHDVEAELCLREENQLTGLKAWVRGTYQDINGKPAPY
ncbi:MAG: hypothetical protein KGI71_06550 [Patescibacteria group bacterium]|nr:hypothetical protein [Patescibacteria group bacterium]